MEPIPAAPLKAIADAGIAFSFQLVFSQWSLSRRSFCLLSGKMKFMYQQLAASAYERSAILVFAVLLNGCKSWLQCSHPKGKGYFINRADSLVLHKCSKKTVSQKRWGNPFFKFFFSLNDSSNSLHSSQGSGNKEWHPQMKIQLHPMPGHSPS